MGEASSINSYSRTIRRRVFRLSVPESAETHRQGGNPLFVLGNLARIAL
jgi:hypothetical protein